MPETMSQIVSIFESEKDEVMFDEEQINTNGMAPEQINFLIGVGCLLVILLVVGTIWCYYDYKCLFWDLKNRYYKPKGSVKTAREGGVSGGGARKKTTNSNRRADGREDRKKPSNDSVLLPPPPPPVNRTSTVSSNLNTQKESSKQSTVEGKTQRTTKDSVKTDTDTL
uniref:Uncharacterized protein n=2 Tax=Caenorhabditis tropicalis TaxID=1561998 RepID=A0A1I7UK01_9PELO